jgi:hypothetical protein
LIEPAFEIFCACLPCMTPVLKAGRYLAQKSSSLRASSKDSSGFKGSKGSYGEYASTGNVSQVSAHHHLQNYPQSSHQYLAPAVNGPQYEMLDDGGSGFHQPRQTGRSF